MRWVLTFLLALVATVIAQDKPNAINTPMGGFNVQAGQSYTITWANPSSGNVEIRLTQGGVVQPGDGIELVPSTPASAGTATFTIPEGADLDGQTYNFEIIDLTDPSNPNFSAGFTIAGASGTGSTTASGSMMTATSNSTMTVTSSDSSSTSTGTASTTHSSSHSSSGSSSASATQSTSAPSSGNGAASLQVGGLLAVAAGIIAVF